jgi:hypothetical protein
MVGRSLLLCALTTVASPWIAVSAYAQNAAQEAIQQENALKNSGMTQGGSGSSSGTASGTSGSSSSGTSGSGLITTGSGGSSSTGGGGSTTTTTAAPTTTTTGGVSAGAAVCRESSGGQSYQDCDMDYRDTKITCNDTYRATSKDGTLTVPSTNAPCPARAAPMKSTKPTTFKDLSPYLYDYMRDPEDKTKPYSGDLWRGTTGDPMQTMAVIGASPNGVAKQKSCVDQLQLPSSISTLADQAKFIRLQLDNCTNQFILNASIYPFQKENSSVLCDDTKGRKCSLADLCQPLRTTTDPKQEYLVSDYLRAAWKKTMQDPAYRKNPDAPNEPHLPTGVKLKHSIPMPEAANAEITLSAIAAVPYEEIVDPTHPFSPRWDYATNERDKYSPMTASYGGDAANGVFCAGDKSKNIIKVDILSFREKALDFDDKVTDRIKFNQNCKANTGDQKDPCCIVQPTADPTMASWTCRRLPCATCYAMTANNPVCATD